MPDSPTSQSQMIPLSEAHLFKLEALEKNSKIPKEVENSSIFGQNEFDFD